MPPKVTLKKTKPRRARGQRGRRGRRQIVAVVPAQTRQRRTRRRRPQRQGFLGQIIGNVMPGVAGAARGVAAGINSIFGRGDYVINPTPKVNTFSGSNPPAFGGIGGATRIKHREYIGDISGSIGFSVSSFPIAPGRPALFPWLSRVAANYETYRIMGLVVEFKSTSANALNSTNTALGVVGLVTQYDASEPNFINKQEAENYDGAQSCSPAQSMLHFVECAKGQNPLEKMYVRTEDLVNDEDIKFYDMGKIQLFTQGMQAVATIGELWVSYDIEFSKPKMPTGGTGGSNLIDVYRFANMSTESAFDGVPYISNVGTTMDNLDIIFNSNVPRGFYAVICLATPAGGTGNFNIASSITVSGSCVLSPLYNNGANSVLYGGGNTTSAPCIGACASVQLYTAGTGTVTINGFGHDVGVTVNIDVFVISIPQLTVGKPTFKQRFYELERMFKSFMAQHNPSVPKSLGETEILDTK